MQAAPQAAIEPSEKSVASGGTNRGSQASSRWYREQWGQLCVIMGAVAPQCECCHPDHRRAAIRSRAGGVGRAMRRKAHFWMAECRGADPRAGRHMLLGHAFAPSRIASLRSADRVAVEHPAAPSPGATDWLPMDAGPASSRSKSTVLTEA